MADPVEDVLRLVAEGRLTPAEAAPIIEALSAADRASRGPAAAPAVPDNRANSGRARPSGSSGPSAASAPNRIRVQVRENGRVVVDLQVPGALAGLAGSLPGIPAGYADRVREALRTGLRGPIVDIRDEDDSGLTITID